MSKPDWCTQEIWDKALSLSKDLGLQYSAKPHHFTIARAIIAATEAEREAIIQVCEAQKAAFLSPEYSFPQPAGSICERFAIDECIAAIRNRTQA